MQPVALKRGDTRRILSTVLQNGQGIIDGWRDRLLADYADDSTHSDYPLITNHGVLFRANSTTRNPSSVG